MRIAAIFTNAGLEVPSGLSSQHLVSRVLLMLAVETVRLSIFPAEQSLTWIIDHFSALDECYAGRDESSRGG